MDAGTPDRIAGCAARGDAPTSTRHGVVGVGGKSDHDQAAVARGAVARRAKGGERRDAQAWSSLARGKECWRRDVGCALLAAGCWLLLLAVGGLAAGELQPRRWPTVGRFQPWAAASEQAEGSGWTKGNTEKEEGNNTTTLR